EDESNSEAISHVSREFVDSYYKSLGNGPASLLRFFSVKSIMDQIFIDQAPVRSSNPQVF
ncbi:hypothetical protein MXB_4359, partial [Myxobolus squamalis]